MGKDAKKQLWKSPGGVATAKKKQKSSTVSPAVLCELHRVAHFTHKFIYLPKWRS